MKKIFLFPAAFLFSFTFVKAQYFNPPTQAFATGTGPSFIISADFNGDAKPDLVIANTSSNNVSVMLGTGTGSFGAAVNFAVGTSPFAITSGNFNADANLDLAVCNAGSNNVSILLGNGTGGFGAATNFATGTGPRGITSGDFNGDTKTDLATANYNGANISILPGTGTGTFGAPINFAAGTGPRSIITAYLNGDAYLDLAVANETSNNISVLIGTGTGNFAAPANFAVGTTPHSITSADLNGDLIKDLVTANSGSDNVSVLIGAGTGSFSAAANFAVGTTPYSVISSDLNVDGNADLVIANFSSTNMSNFKSVSALLGTGTGSFGSALSFGSTVWTVPANPSSLISGDFNGDTKPDVAIANNAYNSVSVLKSFIPTIGRCPAPMRIVILGASSSFGFNANPIDSAYAYRFRQFIIDSVNGYSEIINLAHAGYTTYAMQRTGYPVPTAYPIDTLRNITKAISLNPDGVIFNFTTNDINALFPLDTTISNFLRSTNLLDSLGIKYWVTTTQPRNFTGDTPQNIVLKKQMLLDLRDSLIMMYPLNYIESYLGFADVNGDILSIYDSGDNTHFNNAGHFKLFTNVKNKNIQTILCPAQANVTENAANKNFTIYPNPFNYSATVQFDPPVKNGELILYNVYGQKTRTISHVTGNEIKIFRNDLLTGVYFIQLIQDNKVTAIYKLVVND